MNDQSDQVLVAFAEKREEETKRGNKPNDPIYVVDGEETAAQHSAA